MTIKDKIESIKGRTLVDDYDELPVADLKALATSRTALLDAAEAVVQNFGTDEDCLEALQAEIKEAEKL